MNESHTRISLFPNLQSLNSEILANKIAKIERAEPVRLVRFAAFEVNLPLRELRKHGLRIRLAEKPFQILEMLLENPGQVVTRIALREKLWPDTHVGYEHSLNTAVNTLRALLGDSAQNPRFIETLPRFGYRFICEVTKVGIATQSDRTKKMLVVLPFENFGGNTDQDRFADGLTEEMISQLAQLSPKRLGIVARTSTMQYKGSKKPIGEIGRELHVDYALEGSVRHEAQRVRITTQLIDANEETHLWSASYDHEMREVLELQVSVAREIGKALASELIPES